MPLPKPNPGSTDHSHFNLDSLPEEIVVSSDKRGSLGGRPKARDARGVKRRHGWYSDAQKLKAACTFAVTGNSRRVSEIVNVPEGTIRAWKTTEWWNEIQGRIRMEHNDELDVKFTKAIDKAVEQVNDRIEHGDYIYNAREDKLVRKPAGVRDLAVVTAQLIDKRQLLRGEPTSRTAKVSENEKLVRLAEEFKKFALAKTIDSQAIQIEEELGEEVIIQEQEILPQEEDYEEDTLTINQMFSE